MTKQAPDKAYRQGDPKGPELLDLIDDLILELDRSRRFFSEIQAHLLPREKRTWARLNLAIRAQIERARQLHDYYQARYTLFEIDGTEIPWFEEPGELRR